MDVRRLDDPSTFLEETAELRAADPVRTNVLGSVATGAVEGITYDDRSFFVVREGDDVVGAALWTPPYNLLLGQMDDAAARATGLAAAERSRQNGFPIPGVVGPHGTAELAAAAVGGTWRTTMAERVLVLHDYLAPSRVPGEVRRARETDLPLLREWSVAFAADAGLVAAKDDDGSLLLRAHRTWFWEVDGVPVAMAGHAPVVPTPVGAVARVGPVYTPPEHRRRGYASAATGAVVEHLLPRTATIMLYADAANPTSNHVYEALGFVHEDDVVELTFGAVTTG